MDKHRRQSIDDGDAVSRWSRKKYASLATLTVVLTLAVGLVAVESALRYQDRRIAHSEHMAPGLIRYDPELGWELTPGWSGVHHHYDYDVEYDIDDSGFRVDPQAGKTGPRVVVLGDSFTFGLGVANDETFVSRLNANGDDRRQYLNLGVPGYSTDQELLLLRKAGNALKPNIVLLVVYLANDLFDNNRPFPLQADHAKPYFRLDTNGRLVPMNTPVPLATKSAAARSTGLANVVLGDELPPPPLLTRTLGQLSIARRLGIFQQPGRVDERVIQSRLENYIALFLTLADALEDTGPELGAKLVIALLPGPTFINQPGSLSALYQAFLRKQLVAGLAGRPDIQLIDLASMLAAADDDSQPWYFPHEGHLTPQGHQLVARLLAANLEPHDGTR
jgi:lysophospholipase L1-like esterase